MKTLDFFPSFDPSMKNFNFKMSISIFFQREFRTGWWSIVQSFAMMIGELNYSGYLFILKLQELYFFVLWIFRNL